VCTCRPEPSRWLQCTVTSHHHHRCCPRLPSSALRRSDSGANHSTMRSRAGCFAVGQLLPHLCVLLGHPVPSLTEASRRPTVSVDHCQDRCAAMMSRQELGNDASRNASASSFLTDTTCGRLASSSLAPCRVGFMRWHAHARHVALSSATPCLAHPSQRRMNKLLRHRLHANPLPLSTSLHARARACALTLFEH
jgi:hypothetical protein